MALRRGVYLIDTDVISELRKKEKANAGVVTFFRNAASNGTALYLSAVSMGELRRGVESIRYRGDAKQAQRLERWLGKLMTEYSESILPFDADTAQIWGRLRVPHPENPLDKQIAATALIYDLTLVTRNVRRFAETGVKLLEPFSSD